jgi:hypothetical protein
MDALMRYLLLLLLVFTACQKCPKRVPPYTWHPLLSDETIFSRGKIRKRPLYKVKVPTSWKRLLDIDPVTFQISEKVQLTVTRLPGKEIPPLMGTALQTSCFVGSFWHESGLTQDHLIWTLKPDPSIVKGLQAPGQNKEEELFFKQMISTVQIEVTGPASELVERDDEIQQFLNSFTFIQGVPGQ